MNRIQLKTLWLASAAAGVLTLLFILQRPVDPAQHNAFTGHMLQFKLLDAELNRDVLSSRYELLRSYDPFVHEFAKMRVAAEGMKQIPSFVNGRTRREVEQAIQHQFELLARKERLVETFKSENAILRNSLRYFPALIADACREARLSGDRHLENSLSNLLRDMLLYQLTPSKELRGNLDDELEQIGKAQIGTARIGRAHLRSTLDAVLDNVKAHSGTIMRERPRLQEITESLIAIPLAGNLESISAEYLRSYDRELKLKSIDRSALYLCSVFLLLFAVNRAISLVMSRQVLEQANRRLHAAQERYELAVRGANDGVWDWDLLTDTIYLSPRWKEMLGFSSEELMDLPTTWTGRIHPDDRDRVRHEWDSHLANRTPVFESEHRILHRDGTYRWVLTRGMAVRGADNQALRIAGSQTDITGNKLSDPLTGLANRLLFIERLSYLIHSARRNHKANYAVFFLDVDRFKVVNDSLGHVAGDSLLQQIAQRLKGCVRASDTVCRLFADSTVARLGGDEFAILLEGCSEREQAQVVSERILAEFAQPFQLAGKEVVTTFSVGVALGNPNYNTPEDVLRDADIAMYEAKLSGKARAGVFDPEMRKRAIDRLETEADIRAGIDHGEFVVYYQPKVNLDTGKLVGFEALVRWQHSSRGLVMPSDFIPVAEETGLIVPLGYWILRSACRQLKHWRELYQDTSLTISVNISQRQLMAPDFIDTVAAIIQDSGVPGNSLSLELTETAVMTNPAAAAQTLHRLKALGIRLDMDDFGTGYSSLSYLQRLPFDTIKVDRSFIAGLGGRAEDRDLIRTILDLAKNFQMEVVAEGIETELQRTELVRLGCAQGQGYLFSKPVPASCAEEMLRDGERREDPGPCRLELINS